MKLLWLYFRRQYKILLLLLGMAGIFAAVFRLYQLPLEAVLYAVLLCGIWGGLLFLVSFLSFLRRHRELQWLLTQTKEKVLLLPPPRGLWRPITMPL